MIKKCLGCLFYIFIFIIVEIGAKRGGGGSRSSGGSRSGGGIRSSFRSSGSRSSGSAFRFSGLRFSRSGPSYRSISTGSRWSSYGSGIIAYSSMSNFAHRSAFRSGYYRSSGGYYSYRSQNKSSDLGNICINEESFNGSVYGKFECPLPDFDPTAIYCCGSAVEKRQFCCNFYDKYGREESGPLTSWILVFIAIGVFIIVGAILLIRKIIVRYENKKKENEENNDEEQNLDVEDQAKNLPPQSDEQPFLNKENNENNKYEEPPNYKSLP